MTLNFERDLYRVEMNQRAKYLGHRYLVQKLLSLPGPLSWLVIKSRAAWSTRVSMTFSGKSKIWIVRGTLEESCVPRVIKLRVMNCEWRRLNAVSINANDDIDNWVHISLLLRRSSCPGLWAHIGGVGAAVVLYQSDKAIGVMIEFRIP